MIILEFKLKGKPQQFQALDEAIRTTQLVAVPPQYTTQECSRCDTLVKKTLSERTHICPQYGLVLGRDHNSG